MKIKSADLLHKIEPLPGAVCKQFMRCGKANCKCSQGMLHGPYFVRFWYEDGRQRKQYVKKSHLQSVFDACSEHKRQQRLPREIISTTKELCRALRFLLKAGQRGVRI
jgi:hypothetical protein